MAYMAVLDLQECFLHWLAAPASRRSLYVRNPVTGRLSVFLHSPRALRVSPGRAGRCVGEVSRLAAAIRPLVRTIDFAGDLRLAESRGARNQLFFGTSCK